MATHSSVLAWRIPGTGEPGGLPSMGSHRFGHDWSDLAAAAAALLIVFQTSAFEDRCCCRLPFKTVYGKPGLKANILSGMSTRVYSVLFSLLGEKLYDLRNILKRAVLSVCAPVRTHMLCTCQWIWRWMKFYVNEVFYDHSDDFNYLCIVKFTIILVNFKTKILQIAKSLHMVIAAMKLKDTYSLEGKLWPT